MIAWLQRYLINKWFFALLLGVVIVAFVLTITPAGGGLTGTGETVSERRYFGLNLASRKDVGPIIAAAEASTWINSGRRLFDQNQLQQLALQRTAFLSLAEEIGIPKPSQKEIEDSIRSKRHFADAEGNFSEDAYTRFIDTVRTDTEITEELIMQALIEDHRIRRVRESLIGPGHVMPYEAIKQIENEKTVWSVDVATYKSDDFSPDLAIDDDQLASYYEANKFNYEEEAKVETDGVKFSIASHIGRVAAPTELDLKAYFDDNLDAFRKQFIPEEDKEEEPPSITFETAREKVRERWIAEKANRLAAESADAFTEHIYSESIARDSSEFNELLSETGAEIVEITPYTRSQSSNLSGIPASGLQTAFTLNERRYYSDVIQGEEGAYVLIFKGEIESRTPELAEVLDKVRTDFLKNERKRQFVERGKTLKETFEKGIVEGKEFQEMAEGEGLEVKTFEEFTSNQPPQEFNRSLFSQNTYLNPGQISAMVLINGDGKFVHIRNKDIPDDGSDIKETENKLNQIANINSYYATIGGLDLISEIMAKELETTDTN